MAKKRKRIVVVGLGNFGTSVATSLYKDGHDVLAIDINEERVNAIKGHVSYAVEGDSTNEDVLTELGVRDFDVAIVAMGHHEKESIMTTVLLTSLGLSMIMARADSELHANTLERLGCHKVIRVEQEMGEQVADSIGALEWSHLDLQNDMSVIQINLAERYDGWTLSALLQSVKISVKKVGKEIRVLLANRPVADEKSFQQIWAPDVEMQLHTGDELLIYGSEDDLINLEKLYHKPGSQKANS